MQTTEQKKQPHDLEKLEREAQGALLGKQVLRTLGSPGALLQVQARFLWDKYYRVNVFVGPDPASAKVAHSYFVGLDKDGNIAESTPKIKQLY